MRQIRLRGKWFVVATRFRRLAVRKVAATYDWDINKLCYGFKMNGK